MSMAFPILCLWFLVPVGAGQALGTQAATNAPCTGIAKEKANSLDRDTLIKNSFVESEPGIFKCGKMTIGDLKRLLRFDVSAMQSSSSAPIGYPGYWISFPSGHCVVDVLEANKDIHDDATLVRVAVNTNAPLSRSGGLAHATNTIERVRKPQEKPSLKE